MAAKEVRFGGDARALVASDVHRARIEKGAQAKVAQFLADEAEVPDEHVAVILAGGGQQAAIPREAQGFTGVQEGQLASVGNRDELDAAVSAVEEAKFPYIPSFLSYRELPLLRPLICTDERTVYLIDGQGRLHPRGFGIACHVGVCLDVPTIGAAKSLLQGKVEGDGRRAPVIMNDKPVGCRLHPAGRTRTYVSVGHRVSLETAADLCERLMIKGVPEPLRLAHMRCGEMARKAKDTSGGACAS